MLVYQRVTTFRISLFRYKSKSLKPTPTRRGCSATKRSMTKRSRFASSFWRLSSPTVHPRTLVENQAVLRLVWEKKLENMPPYYVVIMGVINNMTLINCHPIMLMNKNSGVYMFPVSNLNEVLKWCIIWWWGKAEKVPCLLSGLMCFLMRTSLLSQCCWICTPQTKVRMDFQCFNRNIDQQRHTYVCIYTHTKSS